MHDLEREGNWSSRLQEVMSRAHEFARVRGQQVAPTELILYALLCEEEGIVPQVLDQFPVEMEDLTAACCAVSSDDVSVRHGNSATDAITAAINVANQVGDVRLCTEHIFLGILNLHDCAARKILLEAGLEPSMVTEEIRRLLGQTEFEAFTAAELQLINGIEEVTGANGRKALQIALACIHELKQRGELSAIVSRYKPTAVPQG